MIDLPQITFPAEDVEANVRSLIKAIKQGQAASAAAETTTKKTKGGQSLIDVSHLRLTSECCLLRRFCHPPRQPGGYSGTLYRDQ